MNEVRNKVQELDQGLQIQKESSIKNIRKRAFPKKNEAITINPFDEFAEMQVN